jgi:hypothetical protein
MIEFIVDKVQSTKYQTVSRAMVPGTTTVFTLVEYVDADGGGVNLHIGQRNFPYETRELALAVADIAARELSIALGIH